MDTSKEYIKMCEKAVEVQKWRCEVYSKLYCGDFYKGIGGKVRVCVEASKYLVKGVWLPRQDQLQNMLDCRDYVFQRWIERLLVKFNNFAISITTYEPIPSSMEQLWLVFVMKEKYSKTWNGEGWE